MLDVEALEVRSTPSVSLSSGVLTIEGSDYYDSASALVSSEFTLILTVKDSSGKTLSSKSYSYPKADVKKIVFHGRAGNDRLLVSARFTGDVLAYGGSGNDYLSGGSGNDRLEGGEGVDLIVGGVGDDVLLGGGGKDFVYGSEGADLLFGQDGDDYVYGQEGNDTLYGGTGNDTLDGGPGKDSLHGGAGVDKEMQ